MNTHYRKLTSYLLLFFFLGVFSSCEDLLNNDEEQEQPSSNVYLVDKSLKLEHTEETLKALVQLGYGPDVANYFTKGIKAYVITYRSIYEGNEVELSGVLSVPDDAMTNAYPLLLAQRGTITRDVDAPSLSGIPVYELFAGAEYITFTPDLIGFGASADLDHPYFDYRYTATASIDMYRAVLEALEELEVQKTDEFYITGYSQGGYSALATHKYIQENESDIIVTANAPGAGGYDLKTLIANIVAEDTYPSPVLLTMPILTYNNLYVKGELTDYFNPTYASKLPELLNGTANVDGINLQLTQNLADLFNTDFLANLRSDEGTTVLDQYFEANSVHDWTPTAPITFYHHTQDEIIAVESTEATVASMSDGGATVNYIELDQFTPAIEEGKSVHGEAAIYSFVQSLLLLRTIEAN
ncbi:lipase family protein [Sediminitomix flava]|uniref:Secretory lipase n=1 Tax=Sediminitomix flava TaxID=379075 RepID=A0A315Z9Q4_SEDFL|nr:lipase family protein [Sediminitomix flava]PWJ42305.1 secretory lipase [Sediminitomix flava]